MIPTSGINGVEERERRATSALLADLGAGKEFGRTFVKAFGAPAAAVDAGHRLSVDSGRFGSDWHQQGDHVIKPVVCMGGLANLVALVESEDPIVAGEFLTSEQEMSLPLHTHKALTARRNSVGTGLSTCSRGSRRSTAAGSPS